MQWLLHSVIQQISIEYLSLEVILYTCIRDFWSDIAQISYNARYVFPISTQVYLSRTSFGKPQKNYKLWNIEEGKNNMDVF